MANLDQQISDIRSGDPRRRDRVLRSLYEHPTVAPKVRSWLKQYGAAGQRAEDIIQEAVLLLYEKVLDRQFAAKSALTTFLLGIAFNLIRNQGRKVERVDFLPEYDTLDVADLEHPEQQMILVEATAASERRDHLLRRAIEELKESCREALRLYYFKEKSTAEVAEARNLKNANQGKKLLSRCRQRLRTLIENQPGYAELQKHS